MKYEFWSIGSWLSSVIYTLYIDKKLNRISIPSKVFLLLLLFLGRKTQFFIPKQKFRSKVITLRNFLTILLHLFTLTHRMIIIIILPWRETINQHTKWNCGGFFHVMIIFIAHMTYDFSNFSIAFLTMPLVLWVCICDSVQLHKMNVLYLPEMKMKKKKNEKTVFVNLKHKFHLEFTYVLLSHKNGYMGG